MLFIKNIPEIFTSFKKSLLIFFTCFFIFSFSLNAFKPIKANANPILVAEGGYYLVLGVVALLGALYTFEDAESLNISVSEVIDNLSSAQKWAIANAYKLGNGAFNIASDQVQRLALIIKDLFSAPPVVYDYTVKVLPDKQETKTLPTKNIDNVEVTNEPPVLYLGAKLVDGGIVSEEYCNWGTTNVMYNGHRLWIDGWYAKIDDNNWTFTDGPDVPTCFVLADIHGFKTYYLVTKKDGVCSVKGTLKSQIKNNKEVDMSTISAPVSKGLSIPNTGDLVVHYPKEISSPDVVGNIDLSSIPYTGDIMGTDVYDGYLDLSGSPDVYSPAIPSVPDVVGLTHPSVANTTASTITKIDGSSLSKTESESGSLGILDYLKSILNYLKNLINNLGELLRYLFIPTQDALNVPVTNLRNNLIGAYGLSLADIKRLDPNYSGSMVGSKDADDNISTSALYGCPIFAPVVIGGMEFSLSSIYCNYFTYYDKFRYLLQPILSGFVCILLTFFWYKIILWIFGVNSLFSTGSYVAGEIRGGKK